MQRLAELVKKPIYLKALLIIRCIILETYVYPMVGKVLGIIIIVWSTVYLLHDMLHEKRFINHKWSFFPITFCLLICSSLIFNAIRYGNIVAALKSIIVDVIFLLILVAPSGVTNIEERNREIFWLANVLIITVSPLSIIGAGLYLIRVNVWLPFLQIPESNLLVGNEKVYNTYWIERFFTPLVNPNGAAALLAITCLAVGLCLIKKQRFMLKVWYYIVLISSLVVFWGCASRGAILGFAVSIGLCVALMLKKYFLNRKMKYTKISFSLTVGAGGIACLLIVGASLWMSSALPQVSSLATEKYVEYISIMSERKNDNSDLEREEQIVDADVKNEVEQSASNSAVLAPYATESVNRDMAEADGIQTRINIWKVYMNNVKYHPWLGIGINHDIIPYENYIDEHYESEEQVPAIIDRIYDNTFGCHNAYVDLIARYGVPAFLFFFCFVYVIQRYAIELATKKDTSKRVCNEDMLLIALVAFVMTLGLTGSYLLGAYSLPNVTLWGAVGYLCNTDYSSEWLEKFDFNLMHYLKKVKHKTHMKISA